MHYKRELKAAVGPNKGSSDSHRKSCHLKKEVDVSQSSYTVPSPTYACRRIPCKARGMSEKHDIKTAYMEIPANAPHGLLLACSNAECSAAGIRFRYCKECRCPVAKRNFHRRHAHGCARTKYPEKEDCLASEKSFTKMEVSLRVAPLVDDLSAPTPTNMPQLDVPMLQINDFVAATNAAFRSHTIDANIDHADVEPATNQHYKMGVKYSSEMTHKTDTKTTFCQRTNDSAFQAAWVSRVFDHRSGVQQHCQHRPSVQQQCQQQAVSSYDNRQPPIAIVSMNTSEQLFHDNKVSATNSNDQKSLGLSHEGSFPMEHSDHHHKQSYDEFATAKQLPFETDSDDCLSGKTCVTSATLSSAQSWSDFSVLEGIIDDDFEF